MGLVLFDKGDPPAIRRRRRGVHPSTCCLRVDLCFSAPIIPSIGQDDFDIFGHLVIGVMMSNQDREVRESVEDGGQLDSSFNTGQFLVN